MPTVNEIIAMRQRRRSRQEHNLVGRLGMSCSLLLSLLTALALIVIALLYKPGSDFAFPGRTARSTQSD